MKHRLLNASVLLALSVICGNASATGLVSIPAAGFTVPANTGTIGTVTSSTDTAPNTISTSYTSAYTLCNQTGNFGSSSAGSTAPTTSLNNTCAVFPTSATTSPVSGYTLVASTTTSIILNDTTHTGGTNVNVGTLTDYVWRNSAANSCIYGARYALNNTIYNPAQPASQQGTIEFDDLARAGWSALDSTNPVNAGYFYIPSGSSASSEVLFRIGRAYTSVQHRAYPTDTTANYAASGYVNLPNVTTAPPSGTTINGQTSAWTDPMPAATASQQTAAVDANWVDFTTDVNNSDTGCTSHCAKANSSLFYVQASCTSATPTQLTGAIRLRQTGQETGDLVEIALPAYAPAGATTAY